MKYNLPDRVWQDIVKLAKKYAIEKVILFGSRARGDNRERSDIDLAVSGGNITEFALAVEEDVWTLLMFDVVNLDGLVSKELLAEIAKEGILLYEKA